MNKVWLKSISEKKTTYKNPFLRGRPLWKIALNIFESKPLCIGILNLNNDTLKLPNIFGKFIEMREMGFINTKR